MKRTSNFLARQPFGSSAVTNEDIVEKLQLRAARALVGWSQEDLATAAGVSAQTVKRMEGDGPGSTAPESQDRVKRALEAEGVEFIHGLSGYGVKLNRLEFGMTAAMGEAIKDLLKMLNAMISMNRDINSDPGRARHLEAAQRHMLGALASVESDLSRLRGDT